MGKQGVRQRLLSNQDDEPQESAAASSSADSRSVRRRVAAGQPGAAEVAASTGEGRPLPLLASLKKEWCKGHLSAKQVQEFAMGAEAQGAYGMTATASAGTRGKNPQNIHRTLASLFGTPKGCPSMTWSEVPTKSGKFMHPFFLPHMSFASLAAECPELFQSAMLGPEGGCSAFWTMMHDTPFVREHPVLAPDNKHKTIPLGFYGDGGGLLAPRFFACVHIQQPTWHREDNVEAVCDHLCEEVRHHPRHPRVHLQDHRLVFQCPGDGPLARGGLDEATSGSAWLSRQWPARMFVSSPRRLGVLHIYLRLPKVERSEEHVLDVRGFSGWPHDLRRLLTSCTVEGHEEIA